MKRYTHYYEPGDYGDSYMSGVSHDEVLREYGTEFVTYTDHKLVVQEAITAMERVYGQLMFQSQAVAMNTLEDAISKLKEQNSG